MGLPENKMDGEEKMWSLVTFLLCLTVTVLITAIAIGSDRSGVRYVNLKSECAKAGANWNGDTNSCKFK